MTGSSTSFRIRNLRVAHPGRGAARGAGHSQGVGGDDGTPRRRARESRQVEELAASIGRQRQLAAEGNQEAFHAADEEFHAMLAKIAGYPGVWRLVQQVKLQVDRFRRLTLPQKGRMQRVVREHAAVVGAIKEQEPQEAARRMALHLDALLVDLKNLQNLEPEYFSNGEDRT